MSINTDLQRALNLAKAGKLKEAQALLLTIDTPQAERLLDKVNKAIAARGASASPVSPETVAKGIKQAEQEKQKNLGYGCLFFLLMACICSSVIAYVGAPKPEENLVKMCSLVRSVNFQCDPAQILRDYPNEVAYCQTTYGNFVELEELKYTWQNCLRSQGVQFIPEPAN